MNLSSASEDQSFLTLAKSFQDLIIDTVEKDKTIAFSKERITQNLSTTVGEKSKVPGIEEIVKMRYDFLRKKRVLEVCFIFYLLDDLV